MKVKWKVILIMVLLITALIASYNIPRRDLRSLSQVAGIALDINGETMVATFELFDPAIDQPIGTERSVISAEGRSITDCLEQIKRVHNAELYLNDAAVLILNSDHLLDEVFSFYSKLSNDHMDLPVFYVNDQSAAEIFEGSGEVISTKLADSAESIDRLQTVRDLMNGEKETVYVQGRGTYEILP